VIRYPLRSAAFPSTPIDCQLYRPPETANFISANGRSYRGADKSLGRPISPCILFDGENISFDAGLVIYIYIYIYIYIPTIMIISRIYETQNLLSL
jgi:hypothetical protein